MLPVCKGKMLEVTYSLCAFVRVAATGSYTEAACQLLPSWGAKWKQCVKPYSNFNITGDRND
jgi:hypothetical protein